MSQSKVPSNTDLTGQVSLITGGGRGLGQGFAQALASAGSDVAVTARTASQVHETVNTINDAGGRAIGFSVDVTDQGSMKHIIRTIEGELGAVDILVNNAGVVSPTGRDSEIEPDDWWRTMEINVKGPYICTRAILPGMIDRGRGRIVNITSSAAYSVHPYVTAYCAAKAALSHFTRCLATAVQESGISVFAYAPGFVRTSITEHVADPTKMPEGSSARYRRHFDAGSDDSMEDATKKLLFLVSGKADALTGRHISIHDPEDEMLRDIDTIRANNLYTLGLIK
jgi:3-oxoacyl-[acyl-carrier protein] reductase